MDTTGVPKEQLPMGNKVLKYSLMSGVRLCPCHNSLTELSDFLWPCWDGSLLGWVSQSISRNVQKELVVFTQYGLYIHLEG